MRTHELARQLQKAAAALLEGPDVEISRLAGEVPVRRQVHKREDFRIAHLAPVVAVRRQGQGRQDVPEQAKLEAIAEILSLTKVQLRSFVERFRLPVRILSRDSAWNVVGKLVVFFREHPEEVQRIRTQASRAGIDANPELAAALEVLLGRER